METWDRLQARLFHLGYLGEELPDVIATSPTRRVWIYGQIATEAADVARVAAECLAQMGGSATVAKL